MFTYFLITDCVTDSVWFHRRDLAVPAPRQCDSLTSRDIVWSVHPGSQPLDVSSPSQSVCVSHRSSAMTRVHPAVLAGEKVACATVSLLLSLGLVF